MKCKKLPRGTSKKDIKETHKQEMIGRRSRQRNAIPDIDARIVYFSKNSLPEYRK